MSAKPRAIVILNHFSHGGTAQKRWERIRPSIEADFDLKVIDTQTDWVSKLYSAIDAGVRVLIAAGGDGTLHDTLNALMNKTGRPKLEEFTVGAIGLGSSNDFHKPVQNSVQGIPVKMDYRKRRIRDLVEVRFENALGVKSTRLFVVSSSIGFVAEANHFFNTGRGLMKILKKYSTAAAIPYAAVKTIFTYRNVGVKMGEPERLWETNLTSFHVMKTQFVAGSFRFDTEVSPNDRKFSVNLMSDLSLLEKIKGVADLSSGKFLKDYSGEKRKHWLADAWEVVSETELPLELDGELYSFTKASFRIFPESIYECL